MNKHTSVKIGGVGGVYIGAAILRPSVGKTTDIRLSPLT